MACVQKYGVANVTKIGVADVSKRGVANVQMAYELPPKLYNAYQVWKRDDDFFKIQEHICQMLLLVSTKLDCFSLM